MRRRGGDLAGALSSGALAAVGLTREPVVAGSDRAAFFSAAYRRCLRTPRSFEGFAEVIETWTSENYDVRTSTCVARDLPNFVGMARD